MEVISINGPGFGAVTCPQGWYRTPNGNCGGPPPKYYSSAAFAVQKALRALGLRAKDNFLASVVTDGVLGKETQDAINKAFTQHIGEGSAPSAFRTGTLSIGEIAQNALNLAIRLNEEILRRGGAPVPVPSKVTIGPAQILPTPPAATTGAPSGKLWALVGLSVLAASIGTYFAITKD